MTKYWQFLIIILPYVNHYLHLFTIVGRQMAWRLVRCVRSDSSEDSLNFTHVTLGSPGGGFGDEVNIESWMNHGYKSWWLSWWIMGDEGHGDDKVSTSYGKSPAICGQIGHGWCGSHPRFDTKSPCLLWLQRLTWLQRSSTLKKRILGRASPLRKISEIVSQFFYELKPITRCYSSMVAEFQSFSGVE